MPKKQRQQHRQGDVYLIPIESIPEGATPVERVAGRIVLAEGEATGHCHAIRAKSATLLQLEQTLYLSVQRGVDLLHEEHATQRVAAGLYEVRRQREYQPGELPRVVAD